MGYRAAKKLPLEPLHQLLTKPLHAGGRVRPLETLVWTSGQVSSARGWQLHYWQSANGWEEKHHEPHPNAHVVVVY